MYIDCKGKACPQPVVLSLKALKELKAGESLEVLVDNAAAVENLKRLGNDKKCATSVKDNGNGTWTLTLCPSGNTEAGGKSEEEEAALYCSTLLQGAGSAGPTVAAIGTDEMGQGDPGLGHILIKSFFYAMAQMDTLPETILFFNGGAKLTIEGAETLADIKALEERGVKILTCGTCLDFYGIKDQLRVGGVTNMYSIAETMMKAGKVIRI